MLRRYHIVVRNRYLSSCLDRRFRRCRHLRRVLNCLSHRDRVHYHFDCRWLYRRCRYHRHRHHVQRYRNIQVTEIAAVTVKITHHKT